METEINSGDYRVAAEILSESPGLATDNHGNLSMRVSDDKFIIKPSGYSFDYIKTHGTYCLVKIVNGPGSMVIFDSNGPKPSVDMIHHAWIYLKNPWVKGIVHTHSTFATAFAMASQKIPVMCTEHADRFGDEIPLVRYSSFDLWGSELAEIIESDDRAFLLEQHGVITLGDDVAEAAENACHLEQIAQKTYHAGMIRQAQGSRPFNSFIHHTEVEKWRKRYVTSYGQ